MIWCTVVGVASMVLSGVLFLVWLAWWDLVCFCWCGVFSMVGSGVLLLMWCGVVSMVGAGVLLLVWCV